VEILFQKMHGTLNDFVVFHDPTDQVALSPTQIVHLCDRRAGIGADGVIAVRKSAKADFFMDYWNADGSVVEMCGNGMRCLAKYVFDNGLTDKTTLTVDTRAGIKTLTLYPGPDGKIERVLVDMGPPIFDPQAIPVLLETDGSPILDYPLEAAGRTFLATILSMGNPHCVVFTDDNIEELPRRFGPIMENHPLFPARVNVEFIRVLDRESIVMRVWERGSGETWACGTGACAAMVAARLKGLVEEQCLVKLAGGNLDISWKGINYPALMKGTAVLAFKGSITI
jgi:diaminopimelate epimerase